MLAALNIAAANSDTLVYTCPTANTRTTFTISVCNKSSAAIAVRIALCPPATAPAGDGSNYIEYDTVLPANQTLERAGLVLMKGQTVLVRSNTVNAVSAVVFGIEE